MQAETMSEVVQDTQHEFWRPPSTPDLGSVAAPEVASVLAEVCTRCRTEFMIGSRFCYACGRRRPEVDAVAQADAAHVANLWTQKVAWIKSLGSRLSWPKIAFPDWLHYLHFHEIKHRIGLPTASFVAFLIGLGCVVGALGVGLMTAKTFVDWQAIQFYRAEWLLAATAAFVAGILLKKSKSDE